MWLNEIYEVVYSMVECLVSIFFLTLVISSNPLGVRHPIEQCGMFTPSFLNFLNINVVPNDQQMRLGGLEDALGDFGVA